MRASVDTNGLWPMDYVKIRLQRPSTARYVFQFSITRAKYRQPAGRQTCMSEGNEMMSNVNVILGYRVRQLNAVTELTDPLRRRSTTNLCTHTSPLNKTITLYVITKYIKSQYVERIVPKHLQYTKCTVQNKCILSIRLKPSLPRSGSLEQSSRVPKWRDGHREGPRTECPEPESWNHYKNAEQRIQDAAVLTRRTLVCRGLSGTIIIIIITRRL